jgi:hypothetical protein
MLFERSIVFGTQILEKEMKILVEFMLQAVL